MRRLEAHGKGILLLHDIHPATVAALPGLLKELKDKGFHIVQVVPAASYVSAMANKPKASEDITAVHWPAQAEAERPPPAKTQARKHKFAGRAEKRKERIAHADKNERRAEHAHRHKRTHTGADGQHKKRAAQRMITNLYGLSN